MSLEAINRLEELIKNIPNRTNQGTFQIECREETIIRKLKNLREENGDTIEALAKHLNIHKSTMSKIENLNQKISLNNLKKAFEFLGAEINFIIKIK